jgi:hypothetical protein
LRLNIDPARGLCAAREHRIKDPPIPRSRIKDAKAAQVEPG